MADDINERYKKAAALRLMTAMAGGPSQPKPPVPNYSAIPMSIAEMDFAQPTMAPPPSMPPAPTHMPPAMNLGPLPPMNADAQQADDAARYRPMPQQAPKPAAMPQMPPVQVEAPAPMPDPRTAGDADMGGYGGSPRVFSQNELYGHLNPTPSLEEIFRREYAANPGQFGKIG